MRFELIDKVVQQDADRLVAVKTVTAAEEYLGDHFPGFPVLPGVLMLEAMVQAGRRLLAGRDGLDRPLVLSQVRNVRYGNMVRPGQSLEIEVTLRGEGSPQQGYELDGTGRVEQQMAVQGRFRLTPLENANADDAGES